MGRYFRNIYDAIQSAWVGMNVTIRHLFMPSVTMQYPEERMEMFDRARNQLFCEIDDCIGCNQCVRACPVDCIYLETEKAAKGEDLGVTSTGTKKRLKVLRFDIDMSLCCYCSLCTYPCPTECLVMTPQYESSVYDRDELLYRFVRPEDRKQAPPEEVTVAAEASEETAAKS